MKTGLLSSKSKLILRRVLPILFAAIIATLPLTKAHAVGITILPGQSVVLVKDNGATSKAVQIHMSNDGKSAIWHTNYDTSLGSVNASNCLGDEGCATSYPEVTLHFRVQTFRAYQRIEGTPYYMIVTYSVYTLEIWFPDDWAQHPELINKF